MSLEIEITMELLSAVNFSDPPMYSDLHLGNHQ